MKKARSSSISIVMITLLVSNLLGCQKVAKKSCVLAIDDFMITYHIDHRNEIINRVMIEIKIDKEAFDHDVEIIDDYLSNYKNHQIIDDYVIIYDDIDIEDDHYSLKKTIDHLTTKGYKCH